MQNAHDLSATCARILLPSFIVFFFFKKILRHEADTRDIVQGFNTVSHYLWVAVLRQDLQHRRFSALDVSNKDQFTSGHQRLRVSSLLHGFNFAPVSVGGKYHSEAAEEGKCDLCLVDGRAPRRMRSVGLIEFATAALYTSEEQPMGAHTFHRLLLHPATTADGLVGPQQQPRRSTSVGLCRGKIPWLDGPEKGVLILNPHTSSWVSTDYFGLFYS